MAVASYKCPNCGAGLQFDPAVQKPHCDFCLSDFTVEELEIARIRLAGPDEDQAGPERGQRIEQQDGPADAGAPETPAHLLGYHCDSCGAEVVTDETTSATFCYYCHNPVLLTERLTGQYKPQKVIPFAIDKERAISLFRTWAGRRRYVPPDFTSASQLEKITGLYLPHWMADYQARIDFAGTATNLRTWISGSMEYTEHKEFAIQRQGTIDVDHLHEVAIRKMDKGLVDSITPYDETQAVDFSMAYLSGFFAEKYDILQPEIQPVVEQRVRQYATTLVNDTIGAYSRINMQRSDIQLSPKGWHYALLPTWILTYLYRGKTYIYAINGQTGKIHGELPVDRKKLSLASGLAAAAVLLIVILGGLFLW